MSAAIELDVASRVRRTAGAPVYHPNAGDTDMGFIAFGDDLLTGVDGMYTCHQTHQQSTSAP